MVMEIEEPAHVYSDENRHVNNHDEEASPPGMMIDHHPIKQIPPPQASSSPFLMFQGSNFMGWQQQQYGIQPQEVVGVVGSFEDEEEEDDEEAARRGDMMRGRKMAGLVVPSSVKPWTSMRYAAAEVIFDRCMDYLEQEHGKWRDYYYYYYRTVFDQKVLDGGLGLSISLW